MQFKNKSTMILTEFKFPLVSIITPTYNQAQFIEETIKSVLGQSYSNIEYIILDAMSTDGTDVILNKYKNEISTIIREKDKGQSDAIVRGFKLAKGELIGWINSDDILYPDCVEKIINSYLVNRDCVLFYNSKVNIINEDGSFNRLIDVEIHNSERLLRHSNTLIQPGSFYTRNALKKVNYFDETLQFSMDLDLWIRLLKIGKFINLEIEPIAAYREWGGTKTSTGDTNLLRERKRMLLGHGARLRDSTIYTINLSLVKSFIKRVPFIKSTKKNLKTFKKLIFLMAYYGFAARLPVARGRYTQWCKVVRQYLGSKLLNYCGKNTNIEKGAFFGTGSKVRLGDNSGIGVDCKLLGKVTIGDNVMMGPEVVFLTTSHDHTSIEIPMINQGFSSEMPIVVGNDVWIGMRSVILPGVKIGNGVIIGACSVVTKDVSSFVVVAGNPAKVINNRV